MTTPQAALSLSSRERGLKPFVSCCVTVPHFLTTRHAHYFKISRQFARSKSVWNDPYSLFHVFREKTLLQRFELGTIVQPTCLCYTTPKFPRQTKAKSVNAWFHVIQQQLLLQMCTIGFRFRAIFHSFCWSWSYDKHNLHLLLSTVNTPASLEGTQTKFVPV